MIKQLREFDTNTGELLVVYDPMQEALYRKASNELWKEADSRNMKPRSHDLERTRDKIQRQYRREGLEIPIYSICQGIQKGGGNNNFAAMVVKQFLMTQKFQVLSSSEEFALLFDRGKRDETDGFRIICRIFGEERVKELMTKAPRNGGEPDLFVYFDHDPKNAWFVEAKRKDESLTPSQKQNFPLIERSLCPIVIARIVPSNDPRHLLSIEGVESPARDIAESHVVATPVSTRKVSKAIWYTVNGVQGAELPTLFVRCLKGLRVSGTADVTLRKDIDPENKIFQFKNHPGYQPFMLQHKPTPEELESVFAVIRSGKTMEYVSDIPRGQVE